MVTIHEACSEPGDVHLNNVKKWLKRTSDVNEKDNGGWTPLHCALRNRNFEITKLLLRHPNISIHCLTRDQTTPLHYAAKANTCQAEVLAKLLDLGAIIDAQQKSGYTPIHDSIASADGKKETTEWFVINGANMNLANKRGDTPLHTAAKLGKLPIALLLIEKGADVDIKNNDGKYCYEICEGANKRELEIILERFSLKNLDPAILRRWKVSHSVAAKMLTYTNALLEGREELTMKLNHFLSLFQLFPESVRGTLSECLTHFLSICETPIFQENMLEAATARFELLKSQPDKMALPVPRGDTLVNNSMIASETNVSRGWIARRPSIHRPASVPTVTDPKIITEWKRYHFSTAIRFMSWAQANQKLQMLTYYYWSDNNEHGFLQKMRLICERMNKLLVELKLKNDTIASTLFNNIVTIYTEMTPNASIGDWMFIFHNFPKLRKKYLEVPNKPTRLVVFGHRIWNEMLIIMAGMETAWHKIHNSKTLDNVTAKSVEKAIFGHRFEVFFPLEFYTIRKIFKVMENEFLESFSLSTFLSRLLLFCSFAPFGLNEMNRLFYSANARYLIYEISKPIFEFYKMIFPNYYQYVQHHENTCLPHILGLYCLHHDNAPPKYYIIEQNLFQSIDKPNTLYKYSPGATNLAHINLGYIVRAQLLEQIELDVVFLQSLNIYKYSLLIGKIDELEEAPKIKSNDNENENYLLYINKDTYFFRINNITINFTESTSRKSTKRITDVETPESYRKKFVRMVGYIVA